MAKISKIYEFMVDSQGNSRCRSDIDRHYSFKRVGTNTIEYYNRRNNSRTIYKVLVRGPKAHVENYIKCLNAMVFSRIYNNYA